MSPYTFIPNSKILIIVKIHKDYSVTLYHGENIMNLEKTLSSFLKTESELLNNIEILINLNKNNLLEKLMIKKKEIDTCEDDLYSNNQ